MKVVARGGKRFRARLCVLAASALVLAVLVSLGAKLNAAHWSNARQRQSAQQAGCSASCGGASATAAAAQSVTTAEAPPGSAGALPALYLPGPHASQRAQPLKSWDVLGLAAAHAAAAPGREAPAQHPPPRVLGIPKVFHRIYIADAKDPSRASATMPLAHERWIQSCQLHYSSRAGWRHMFWDSTAAEELIANHYPWFLPFYRGNTSSAVERSDLVRYAIMHRVGGLYLDSDIECWREGSDFLEGNDVVLQGTHKGEGATNAAIAARPGLPVFLKALELVQKRTIKNPQSGLQAIQRTGPGLLTAALVAVGVPQILGMFNETVQHEGRAYRFHPVGTFVTPCHWWEQDCRQQVYRERISGTADLTRLVGMHRMAGSWISGKQDGIGIINATAELCGGSNHTRGNGLPGGWVVPEIARKSMKDTREALLRAQQAQQQAGQHDGQAAV